jgi:hypothetical protein
MAGGINGDNGRLLDSSYQLSASQPISAAGSTTVVSFSARLTPESLYFLL